MTPGAAVRLLAAALFFSAAAPAAAASRSVWIWEPESYAMLERGRAARDAVKFLKAKGISTVYLYADAYKGRSLIETRPKLYRKLIRRLRRNGITAYALLGSWHLRTHEYVLPGRGAEALAMFRRVLAYNAAARPDERFEGVNLDIEPHMLAAWAADRDALLLNFLELGRGLMALKAEAGASLQVGPAVPFWLDRLELEWNGAKKPVSEHVLDIYDYAALMAYRDRAEGRDGIVAHAASELDYAGKAGKRLVIGVEVTPNEVEKVSFSRLSEAEMERELGLAEAELSKGRAFAGFVIHHFGSYGSWLAGQEAKEGEK